jgi:isopenicillin-N epimerase
VNTLQYARAHFSPSAPPAHDATPVHPGAVGALPARPAADRPPSTYSPLASRWRLDPSLTFLNHGSYGAVPAEVSQYQSDLRARMERDPVRFYKVDLEPLMDDMRRDLGTFLHCEPRDLAPFANATQAICTVLNNITFNPGDEVVITDHEYMSVVNELARLSVRTGLKVVTAKIPFPISSPDEVFTAVAACLTQRTRLVLVSHITSVTSIIFPAERIIAECHRHNIDCFLDATHAPGQIPVNISSLNVAYWVGSGHKWLSAPKGTGILYVRPDKQHNFRPLALSSRAHKLRPERPLFLRDFDYVGTDDYTAILSLPAALRFYERLIPGGWPEIFRRNHELALLARDLVVGRLHSLLGPRFNDDSLLAPTAPDTMTGSMTTLLLPEPAPGMLARPTHYDDPLQDALVSRHGLQLPVWRLASDNRRVIRLSAQLYNTPTQYEHLANALAEELTFEQNLQTPQNLKQAS